MAARQLIEFLRSSLRGLPGPARLAVVLLALAALAAASASLGVSLAVPALHKAEARIEVLENEIETLTRRLETRKARLQVAEQDAQVTRQANQLLRAEEAERLAELQRLRAELDFFHRLAGTSGAQDGLAVYHVALSPTGSGSVYRFVLTLTQNLRRSAITAGTARIELEGTLADRPVRLAWKQITDGKLPEPEFRFKYFQQIEGYLVLPESFIPGRLVVTLDAKSPGKPITRGFDWAALLREAAAPADAAEADPSDAREVQRD